MQKIWSCLLLALLGWTQSTLNAEAEVFQQLDFKLGGVNRTARVYVPHQTTTHGAPVVFVFHGHGGSAQQAARSFSIERYWPEALVVYMQGLPTPGRLTDPEGKLPGWQAAIGEMGDRDLKFFDAALARLRRDYLVDARRIYCTGHSNGGGFTYLLWLARGNVFAAVAPSAAAARYANQLIPKPAMLLAGEQDPLVKFVWQQATMEAVRKVNGCGPVGTPWNKLCTRYPSQIGTAIVTFIYPGGHAFNPAAPALLVKFFQEQSLAPEKG